MAPTASETVPAGAHSAGAQPVAGKPRDSESKFWKFLPTSLCLLAELTLSLCSSDLLIPRLPFLSCQKYLSHSALSLAFERTTTEAWPCPLTTGAMKGFAQWPWHQGVHILRPRGPGEPQACSGAAGPSAGRSAARTRRSADLNPFP